jgi:cytochrome P450
LELVSILRNWTVGELSTTSACIGILAHYLALRPSLEEQLREHSEQLPVAIDEILRIHPPLISSRRVTTRPVELPWDFCLSELPSDIWQLEQRSRSASPYPLESSNT